MRPSSSKAGTSAAIAYDAPAIGRIFDAKMDDRPLDMTLLE